MSSKSMLLMIMYCFTIGNIIAQTGSRQVRLLDLDDALPIVGATFEYGAQRGLSDENGTITFAVSEGNHMKINHISYGSWEWDEYQLQDIIRRQVYYRRTQSINLYPATVIAVRPVLQPDDGVTIDYRERLEHDGAAILNQIPAFNSIRKSGNYGFDPVFRGFKYDQLNVVLNGAQSATAACPNRMDPPTSQMAPNMLDRVEVLKGPHALRFGTGFGATLNFIPAKLRFTDRPDVYGRLSSGYESNGNMIRGEGQVGFSDDRYDLSLFGAWSQGNDYRAGDGRMVPADMLRGSFGANLGVKLSAQQQLRVSTTYNRARDVDFPALPMDLREDDTWMFNARHDIQIGKGHLQSWNTTVFGSIVNHRMDNLLKPLSPRMLNAETIADTYNYGGRTEGFWQFSEGKLFAGADLRVEGAAGTRFRSFLMGPNAGNTVEDNAWQRSYISKTGLFGEFHLNTDLLNYVFSGRIEWNVANISDPGSEFAQVYAETRTGQLNPSFSLGMQKKIGRHLSAGLWLGRAQRSGSLTERFINYFPVGQDPYEMLGNPQLDPEVNNQADLILEWRTESTSVNMSVFASFLQDYISSVIDTALAPRLAMSPGVRPFVNIESAFKTGFELTWTQELFLGLRHQLGLAYTYAQDLERDEPLPEIPPMDLRYTLSGRYLKDKLIPEIGFRHVIRQSRISGVFGETATPAFSLLDVQLGYQFSEKIRLNAGVNNMFDQHYYEHLNRSVRGAEGPIFAQGRNVLAGLSVLF